MQLNLFPMQPKEEIGSYAMIFSHNIAVEWGKGVEMLNRVLVAEFYMTSTSKYIAVSMLVCVCRSPKGMQSIAPLWQMQSAYVLI